MQFQATDRQHFYSAKSLHPSFTLYPLSPLTLWTTVLEHRTHSQLVPGVEYKVHFCTLQRALFPDVMTILCIIVAVLRESRDAEKQRA